MPDAKDKGKYLIVKVNISLVIAGTQKGPKLGLKGYKSRVLGLHGAK